MELSMAWQRIYAFLLFMTIGLLAKPAIYCSRDNYPFVRQ